MDEINVFAKNLKEHRLKMGLTLSQASELTSVSSTMLSQIERGESIPTLSVLWRISNGLKIRFETLMTSRDNRYIANNVFEIAPVISDEQDVFIYNIFSFSPETGMEIYYGEFLPGCNYKSIGHLNAKFEYVFVISGSITIRVENHNYLLSAGDYMTFNSTEEHRYINDSNEMAKVHMVVSYE